jgi:hypothetical protein
MLRSGDPYFVATVANKFIKSAVNMNVLPEELNLECIVIDHKNYVDCNYKFNKNIMDKNNIEIDLEYIKNIFKDKMIMKSIN